MDIAKLRAWWFEKQGLGGSMSGNSPAEVLTATGWARSVGGANPYLTLFTRAGTTREETDRSVADLRIHELPSARNCTYVVPQAHFAVALRMARGNGDPPDIALAKRHLGVTDLEIGNLSDKVLQALEAGPLDPKEMKAPLGEAVRSLGEEGKKRGMATTLPMTLGLLQVTGKIRRVPVEGRLDQQRYKYTLWRNSPVDHSNLSFEEACREFAKLYFGWIGPASRASFQGVSGLGVKASEEAISGLGLVALEEDSDLLIFSHDREALERFQPPSEPKYVLASNLDGLSHLRWGQIQTLVDAEDRDRQVFGPKGLTGLGLLSDLESHGIYDRGRLVGVWEFDADEGKVVWMSFIPPDGSLRTAVRRMEDYGRDQLGDIRSFSLDSPESRKPRLDQIRRSA